MKLKVLGSGSINSRSNSASYLLDDKILVDAPNGVCKALRMNGINPADIKNIVITHFHGDHYFDMPFIFLSRLGLPMDALNIFCDSTGRDKIDSLVSLAFPNIADEINYNIIFKYTSMDTMYLDDWTIKRHVVKHGNMNPSYGYVFNFLGNKLGITGDTSLCDEVKNMVMECKYVICDCNSIMGTDKHMGIDNIKELCALNPRCVIFTSHMNDDTKAELLKLSIPNLRVLNDNEEYNL